MFENVINFFKKLGRKEQIEEKSKNTAKERLHLVLMQDRANVSADFLDMMKQEIIEVIKKNIDVDEKDIDVRLTNKSNEDGTIGAPALYANIPIAGIKEEVKKEKELNKNTEENIENSKEKDKEKQENNKEEKEEKVEEEIVEEVEKDNKVEKIKNDNKDIEIANKSKKEIETDIVTKTETKKSKKIDKNKAKKDTENKPKQEKIVKDTKTNK